MNLNKIEQTDFGFKLSSCYTFTNKVAVNYKSLFP